MTPRKLALTSSGRASCAPSSALRSWSAAHPTSSRRSSLLLLLPLFLFPLFAPSSFAQRPCATGPISFIFIDNHSIFDTADPGLDTRFGWAYRAANALHVRTRRGVIERELLFGPGDCYDEVLLEETERLLRAYDFLARVDVFGIAQPDGSYHVVVNTHDQWSTALDLRVAFDEGVAFEGVRIRESNLLGSGQELGLFYIDRDVTRDYGIAYGTRQFARTRWDLNASVGKTRAGTFVTEGISYPFVGEVGRWGARQSFTREDQFFDYITVDSAGTGSQHLLLPMREKLFDMLIGTRFGNRGNLTVLGAMLSYQELRYPGAVQRPANRDFDERVPVDSTLANEVLAQTQELGSIRVGIVIGQRNIWWTKKRGYDSMRGEQDVALGADAALAFGRSLASLERDNDLVGTFRLYTGIEAGDLLFATRMRIDARRDFNAPSTISEWEDVYGDGELLSYWRPPSIPRHTFFARVAGAAAWNTRTPFQLTLGGDRTLRGYRHERFPGGRRLVLNAEDRIYFGWPLREVLDFGGTVFVDAGRIWPGDVPFGIDSGWRATAGLGFRGSFPAGGRSSFRIDFATPLDAGMNFRNVRVIISASEVLGLRAVNTNDAQLVRSRNEGAEGTLFRMRSQ